MPVRNACDVGGGSTLYQRRELNPAELSHCQFQTSGLKRDGTLKHDYPANEWRLVPLGHWNWKCNQARSNYSTYDQGLLAGMLVLSSQSRLLGTNPIVWLFDQKPVNTFQKSPSPEKATYQFRLTVYHIQGIKKEMADYISRNNFDAVRTRRRGQTGVPAHGLQAGPIHAQCRCTRGLESERLPC